MQVDNILVSQNTFKNNAITNQINERGVKICSANATAIFTPLVNPPG